MLDPIVYLTAEMKSRDLMSRLLIAAHMVKQGFAAVVGQQWGIYGNCDKTFRGAVLFKTANQSMAKCFADFARAGHRVIAADEEALPFDGPALLDNISPAAIADTHLFLAQNEVHRSIVAARYPNVAQRVVGSARVDLLRAARIDHAGAAAELRKDIGPFVLFNTSFGLINSVWGDVATATAKLVEGASFDATSDAGRREIAERLAAERAGENEMIALIRALHLNTTHGLVIRPHPSERADVWRLRFADLPRVRVVEGSDPNPWMLASEIVVHCNSTTGLEAALMERPALNLSPLESWAARFVMRRVNCTVGDASAALAVIGEYLERRTGPLLAAPVEAVTFPRDGAAATAAAMVTELRDAGAQPGKWSGQFAWTRFARPDVQRAKFSVSEAEFRQGIDRLFPAMGVSKVGVMAPLDDSIFLIAP